MWNVDRVDGKEPELKTIKEFLQKARIYKTLNISQTIKSECGNLVDDNFLSDILPICE